jgi:Rrf2 family protein
VRLSKRTEYGLCAIVRLAQLGPKNYVQSRDLAEQEDMPNKFLESILLALRRGGFLESKVGSGGGYRLSRHPREISMGDLIRRLEGRLTVQDKKTDLPAESSSGHLAVRFLNQKLTETIDKALDELTLEQLVEQINRAGGGTQAMYYI